VVDVGVTCEIPSHACEAHWRQTGDQSYAVGLESTTTLEKLGDILGLLSPRQERS
jgi:hypothetical protein